MKCWAQSTVQSQPHSRQGPDSSVHPGQNLLSLVASLGLIMCIGGGDRGGPETPGEAQGEGLGEAPGPAWPAGGVHLAHDQALTGPDIRIPEGQ